MWEMKEASPDNGYGKQGLEEWENVEDLDELQPDKYWRTEEDNGNNTAHTNTINYRNNINHVAQNCLEYGRPRDEFLEGSETKSTKD